MGKFLCPTCGTWRHVDEPDDGPDRCWKCGTLAETVDEWRTREATLDSD